MVTKCGMFKIVSSAVILVIIIAAFTSCGFAPMLYDLIVGGKGGAIQTYTLDVRVHYTGMYYYPSSTTPLFIAVFGYYFDGDEPDIVYMSDPIVTESGRYSFAGLEELSYGVLVFIDFDQNNYPTNGDIFQFYNGKAEDPDEIYLDHDDSVSITLDDSFMWYEYIGPT